MNTENKAEIGGWEEKFDLSWGLAPPGTLKHQKGETIKALIRSLLARQSLPMGISQWLEHGKKYGYDKYLEKNLRAELVKEIEKLQDELEATVCYCSPDNKNKCMSCATLNSIKNLINKH